MSQGTKTMSHEEMAAALDAVRTAATAGFAETNPGRVEQLLGALDTAAMAVDALHTEVPYVGSTDSA